MAGRRPPPTRGARRRVGDMAGSDYLNRSGALQALVMIFFLMLNCSSSLARPLRMMKEKLSGASHGVEGLRFHLLPKGVPVPPSGPSKGLTPDPPESPPRNPLGMTM